MNRSMSIREFCDFHGACPEIRDSVLENYKNMKECWNKLHFEYLAWVATRPGVLTKEELYSICDFVDSEASKVLDGGAYERRTCFINYHFIFKSNDVLFKNFLEVCFLISDESNTPIDIVENRFADWLRKNTKPNFKKVLTNSNNPV